MANKIPSQTDAPRFGSLHVAQWQGGDNRTHTTLYALAVDGGVWQWYPTQNAWVPMDKALTSEAAQRYTAERGDNGR